MKPRILILLTGGTIGSEPAAGDTPILKPAQDPEFLLKRMPELGEIAAITTRSVFNKDSSNVTPGDWTALCHVIKAHMGAYDGIVVTHGTDTLHYTASAIAFAFGTTLDIPIVFTGSMAIPEVLHGDVRTNLVRAVTMACSGITEVSLCFGDVLLRGCCSLKADDKAFQAFASPACPPLVRFTSILTHAAFARKNSTGQFDPATFQPGFDATILQITVLPGLDSALLAPLLTGSVDGIILTSFGSGNIPADGETSLIGFIEQATAKGIPVILGSAFAASPTCNTRYEPGIRAQQAGAIAIPAMTQAATAVKLRWVLHQVKAAIADGSLLADDKLAEVKRMMTQSYVGECPDGEPSP